METRLSAWKPPEGERFHAWTAIILWCVISTILVAFEGGPIAGVLIVLPCVFIAPGLVVVLLLRLRGLALTSTVVLLVGLALGVLVPAFFLYAGFWSPLGTFAVIAAGTVLGASAGIFFDAKRSRHGNSVPTSRRGPLLESDFVARDHGGGQTEHVVAPVRVAAPKPAAANLLVIDVAGAVRSPGRYRLRPGSRIDDAIAAAGGPSADAQLDTVNLAAPIADGEQIVVPARGAAGAAAAEASPAAVGSSPTPPVDLNTTTLEQLTALPGVGALTAQRILDLRQAIDDATAAAGGPSPKAQLDTVNLAAPIADGAQASPAAVGSSPIPPVDLNTATLEQLAALPGVGPLTAQKILDFRQAQGRFHSVAELQGVPGIGPAQMAKLKGLVIT